MATLTQSVIDRVDSITGDPQRKRFALERIALWLNEAQQMIAEASPRAASAHRVFTTAAGARQDLRTDASVKWIRLHDVVCNATSAGLPNGQAVHRVDRTMLDGAAPNWRASAPGPVTFQWMQDERSPFEFDVYPPAVAGSKLLVLASAAPGQVCVLNSGKTALQNPGETIALADGFDVPMVDWALYRLFSLDSSDAEYRNRAQVHLAAARAALGIALKDAA